MANSNRLKWTVPNERANPWYSAFVSLIDQQDASVFASREDRQILLGGGGTICWSTISGLSWTEDIVLTAPISGYRWVIPPAALALSDGQVLIADLVRYPTQVETLTAIVADQVPSSDTYIVIAARVGTALFFRNGFGLRDGLCGTFAPPEQLPSISIVPTPKTVEGTTPNLIAHTHLVQGDYIVRVMLGTTLVGDTATLVLRRESDASVIATITQLGVLVESTTPVTIPATEQYGWTLFGSLVTTISICSEIKLEYA